MSEELRTVVPRRLDPADISRAVARAAARVRRAIAEGGMVLVVDETESRSSRLARLTEELGLPVASGWDLRLIEEPELRALELRESAMRGSVMRGEIGGLDDLHLAVTLDRWRDSAHQVVLVLHPSAASPAMREARFAGAEVFGLPRRRTVLDQAVGTIVPWRSASDLLPLLFASRSPDSSEWTARYEESRAHAVASGAINRVVPVTRVRGVGRVTLATFTQTPIDVESPIRQLKIDISQPWDEDEWVVGGRMIGDDRAIQVTRNDSPYGFDVQLVWGGTPPTPREILDLEDEVLASLASVTRERVLEDRDRADWILVADESLIMRGISPETVLSAGDGRTSIDIRGSGDVDWIARVDSDIRGTVRVDVRFSSGRIVALEVDLDGGPVRTHLEGLLDDPPVAVRIHER